jgi:ATP-dependent RNA helicase DDX24/MAK5
MTSKTSSAWKSVDVSLPDPGSEVNHYDEPSPSVKKRANKRDLEARQFESCGMFYGLQVLDSSMYEVKNNKMIIRTEAKEETPTETVQKKPSKKKAKKQPADGESDGKSQPAKRAAHEEPAEGEKPPKKSKKDTDEKVVKEDPADPESTPPAEVDDKPAPKKKKKRKKKKKKKKPEPEPESKLEPESQISVLDPKVSALQDSWMTSTGGVMLEQKICESLLAQGFETPTPIQAATLPAAILGRRNIVGAAATGSGKTLAYLLPILQHLLDRGDALQHLPLLALVVAPTRELALQVAAECEKLLPRSTGTIVGGLAPHKQIRILDTRKPPIVIGTPGRLWQLVSLLFVVSFRPFDSL